MSRTGGRMNFNTFAERFLYLRKYLGLSQSEFAPKIHKTPGYISQVESGKINMSDGAILSVSNAYFVNPEWLKNGTGDIFLPGHETQPADPDNLAIRIRTVRKHLGLTQAQFADGIGFSKSQVVSVELKRANPSRELVQAIARVYQVNFQWLLTGSGEMMAKEENPDAELDQITRYFLKNDNARALILEAIRYSETSESDDVWNAIRNVIRG